MLDWAWRYRWTLAWMLWITYLAIVMWWFSR